MSYTTSPDPHTRSSSVALLLRLAALERDAEQAASALRRAKPGDPSIPAWQAAVRAWRRERWKQFGCLRELLARAYGVEVR